MKKALYIIGAILLILIITNPGVRAFKEYLGMNTYNGLRRTSNFFVCSIYEGDSKYFAIAGNFFKITRNIEIEEVRKDALKEQADSAILYSDSSDSNHNRISASIFAERIKLRFPQYKNLDHKLLIRKLLVKFPEYQSIVDTNR